ncbi:tetratricopeptide repeat protein [Phenylobacterium sp.]|uniref:tetratricopeptide repeat protein n=1 Tax=Phenylobacterium sp. TaxID=1871053 RepID=UPI002CA23819|nr:tetratricopeptide repeat protein [Phenylobacterium sp.]HVI32615.1 tetratricopeptide repeat protein [Phenylobacterium sp.]
MRKALAGGLGVLTAVAALAIATEAWAAVTVIGGGLAEACSKAALDGERELEFEKLCTRALEEELLSPRDRAGTYVNRGVMKLRRAGWDGAVKDFDTAVRIQPDLGEAYVNRGAAAIGARRYAESLPDINRGLELGVQEPAKAYYNRALAHEGLEDAKSAYFDYQKAIELSPEWTLPREQLTRFSVSRR